MKELDLLKKDWKKNLHSFEQISEAEIYKMIHTRSSSVVKWIFYISIIEFVVLNSIGFLLADNKYDEFLLLHPFSAVLEKINYIVILIFICLFYKNYKTISVLNTSKRLIELILKTRRVVTYYIVWNILIGGITGAYSGLAGFNDGYNAASPENAEKIVEVNLISLFFAMLFIMGIIWLFYRLLYGRFLTKLKKNHQELKKIDY